LPLVLGRNSVNDQVNAIARLPSQPPEHIIFRRDVARSLAKFFTMFDVPITLFHISCSG